MYSSMEAQVEQEALNYLAYQYQRRTKPAEALAHFPQAAAFEAMFQEAMSGAGAADLPEAA